MITPPSEPKGLPWPYKAGTTVTLMDGTQYTVADCGALVRLTRKLDPDNPMTHNNSKRRRYAKGKY